mgnify:CR=1 FL=1
MTVLVGRNDVAAFTGTLALGQGVANLYTNSSSGDNPAATQFVASAKASADKLGLYINAWGTCANIKCWSVIKQPLFND